jgi:hypothetical protein
MKALYLNILTCCRGISLYGVIGEHDSDFKTLKALIHLIANNEKLTIKGGGCNGCAKLIKDGWKKLNALADMGCTKFVIAHDADKRNITDLQSEIVTKIIKPSKITQSYCIVIPVQEIEAWFLADIAAVTKVIPGWTPKAIAKNPELIDNPKEYLEKLSRDKKFRPRYDHVTHNPLIAKHIDLASVSNKCSSFRKLRDFVAPSKYVGP